jgi:glycosyltransferase involved in cell wall biosynthesis
MTVRLFYFPKYKNPYQELLYTHFPAGFVIKSAPLMSAAKSLQEGRGAKVVFHLHWEDAIYKEARSESDASDRVARFAAALERYRQIGGKLAWTVHNLGSHEAVYPAQERTLRKKLSALADAAFVHTRSGGALVLRDLPGLDGRLFIAPHGNYHGVYPVSASREEARRALGYGPGDVVFLAFGLVRAYKRIDWILQAAHSALPRCPAMKVLVAGEILPQLGPVKLEPRGPNVRLALERVPDTEVQRYFAAADFFVFANTRGLTSSSIILAMSFGVPVIAFGFGDASELIQHERQGLLVAAQSPQDLGEAMLRAAAMPAAERARMAASAAATAASLKWEDTGRVHGEALQALFAARPVPK